MRTLRLIYGVTKQDHIRNVNIRLALGAESIISQVEKNLSMREANQLVQNRNPRSELTDPLGLTGSWVRVRERYAGGLPYGGTPGSYASQVPQAPFPYHQLVTAISSVGVPLASSMLGCPFQRQPNKQDQLLGRVPHAHIAAVDVDGLCW